MKKLGAWLIKTAHSIARWWNNLRHTVKCNWNKAIYAISFSMNDCGDGQTICTCKK